MYFPPDYQFIQMLQREREDEARRYRLAATHLAGARARRAAARAARKSGRTTGSSPSSVAPAT